MHGCHSQHGTVGTFVASANGRSLWPVLSAAFHLGLANSLTGQSHCSLADATTGPANDTRGDALVERNGAHRNDEQSERADH